jgi:acyl-CoA thioester hydrolase
MPSATTRSTDHALEPARATSRCELRVRFCETDLMGIVHHGNYLSYMEAGRVDWLHKRGVTYAAWAAGGRHLPVVDATVRYRTPARFDEVLTIETSLVELRNASLRYAYRILRGDTLVCDGSTRLACIDDAHKLQRFTGEMLASFVAGESAPGSAQLR